MDKNSGNCEDADTVVGAVNILVPTFTQLRVLSEFVSTFSSRRKNMNKSLIFPVIFVLVCGGIACATKSPESVTQQQPATGQTSDQPAAGTSARVGTTKIPGMEGLPPGSRCTDIDDDTGNCEEAIDPSTKTVYEKERGAWKIDQDDTLKAQGRTDVPGMEGLPTGSRCTDIDDDTGSCEEAIDPSTKTVYEKERGGWKIDQDDTLKAQGRAGVPGRE